MSNKENMSSWEQEAKHTGDSRDAGDMDFMSFDFLKVENTCLESDKKASMGNSTTDTDRYHIAPPGLERKPSAGSQYRPESQEDASYISVGSTQPAQAQLVAVSQPTVIDIAVSEPPRVDLVNLEVSQREIDSAPERFRENLKGNKKDVVSLHFLMKAPQGYKFLSNFAAGLLGTGHFLRQKLEEIAQKFGYRIMKSREELLYVVHNRVTDFNFTWKRKGKDVESRLFLLDSPVEPLLRVYNVNLTVVL